MRITLRLFVAFSLVGCTTNGVTTQPEPMDPEVVDPAVVPEDPEAPKPETPDEIFVREFDACWAIYVDCQKSKTKDECFPPMETCGVAAYRKLKQGRKQG